MEFHNILKKKIDNVIFEIYKSTREFPKEELYCLTSQIRRSSLSIMLNYIEGFARNNDKVYKNFLNISYGSLKETKYLIYFSFKMKYISEEKYNKILSALDEIGAMPWKLLEGEKSDCSK